MDTKGSYRDLLVWQRGMDLALEVYKLCKFLPATEQFGLCSQMQRAAVSIPSNIAEGRGRGGINEQLQFLKIANGSRTELQTQILLCEKIGYLTRAQTRHVLLLTEELGKMLFTFSQSLKEKKRI
ncbi:MAG: four helix bundle protein [Clostridia bacterium]|nr:four helix bundle protein [Clostridia bacterium]